MSEDFIDFARLVRVQTICEIVKEMLKEFI